MIVLSTGRDDGNSKTRQVKMLDGIPLFVLGFGQGEAIADLKALASRTNGRFVDSSDPSTLDGTALAWTAANMAEVC